MDSETLACCKTVLNKIVAQVVYKEKQVEKEEQILKWKTIGEETRRVNKMFDDGYDKALAEAVGKNVKHLLI